MISSRVNAKTPSPGLSPRTYDPRDYCQIPRMYLNSPPIQSYTCKGSPLRSITVKIFNNIVLKML